MKKYAIFGADGAGKIVFETLGAENVLCFVDNYKKGQKYLEKDIIDIESLVEMHNDVLLIVTSDAFSEICRDLKKMVQKVTYYIWTKDSAIRNRIKAPPPNTIPLELLNDYTMNGLIPVLYWYFMEDKTGGGNRNSATAYEIAFKNLEDKTFQYYGEDINSFYAAFERYNLEGKSVLVWGLAGINCEAMAIWQGAEHVYVVDYNKPVCEHDKITVMNHEELAKSGIKTDVAISFSSFEHDGLGRYGDPLNPNGDLEAMQSAGNFLKDNGCLWLGVPQGQDCLVWNAHRIYGEKRLPLLLKGWDIETVFGPRPPSGSLGSFVQPLMILRKLKNE